jgi:ubiquinol-cytochrome c reductase cytochrome b/c1 subunit
MFASIAILAALPWLDSSKVRSATYRPIYKQLFWVLMADCFVLGYVGGKPAEPPYIAIGQVATAYYFIHFLVILPILGRLERPRPLPTSISKPVLGPPGGGKIPAAAAARMEKP